MTAAATRLQRSSGAVRLSFKTSGSASVVDTLYQDGCSKVRFSGDSGRPYAEAVLINTSGGLTDGDSLTCSANWRADTSALITTQAAERIYRSRGEAASIATVLKVESGATACWLPQETILFDGGRLDRTTEVELSSGAQLFAAESAVFGRTAMGERCETGRLSDRWIVRIDGKPAFSDAVLFDDVIHGSLSEHLSRASIANGAHCIATIVCVSDDQDAQRDAMRTILEQSKLVAGASNLGPLLIVRALARDSQVMRNAIAQLFESSQPFALPRVWDC